MRAVTYAVTGPLRDVINCHCHRCRRFTGHHMAATSAAVDDVAIDDADGLLTWFFPVEDAGYAFCRRCGSSLFWEGAQHARLAVDLRRDARAADRAADRRGVVGQRGQRLPRAPGPARARRGVTQTNAETPVSARPMSSFWTWLVPS